MESFTLAELGLFIGSIGTVITGLIFALQKSRCEDIKCCGIQCKRKVKEEKGVDIPPKGTTPKP